MKKYLIAVLVVLGISVVGVGVVYAKPLPFNTKCWNETVFNCTDFAYEYCQYNGVDVCDILILYGYNGKAGHAISIIRKPFKDDPTSARFYIYEPQNMKDEPITYWDQSINKPKRITAAAMNDLIVKYGKVLGMTTEQMLARTPDKQYLVLDGDVKYNEYFTQYTGVRLFKSFWSDGWFPVNEIRKAVDSMNTAKYAPKQEIPKCSDLINRACVMDAPNYSSKYPYQISEQTKDLQYAGRVCIDNKGLPVTIACINNVVTQVQKGKDLPPVALIAKLDASTYCPLSETSPERAVTLTIDAPQMGPQTLAGFNRYKYFAYIYIDNIFVKTETWSPSDKSFNIDMTNWRGKTATFSPHTVQVEFFVQNEKGEKILSTKTNTIPMNVGPKGCQIAEISSHNITTGNICYSFTAMYDKNPKAKGDFKFNEWMEMKSIPNCSYDSIKVTGAEIMSADNFIIQPGIKNSSGISYSRQKVSAKNGTFRLTETGISAVKFTR